MLWQATFDRKVRLRPEGGAPAGQERPFDLDGYHQPLIVDRMLCISYYGVRCLNRFTGATVWDRAFPVVEDDLARAYAPPVVLGNTLYATGDNRIHALDLATGERRWRSRKANVLPEIQVDGEALYSQLGGRFFHLGKERWEWKGEFGVMVVDRRDGRTRWRFDDAKGSISNLHYEVDRIWFADAKHLYALDRRTGHRLLRTRHRMSEPPTFLVLNRSGQLILVSDDEVAAFDRVGNRLWYVHHPAPRHGIWRRASSQLFQVSGNLLRVASMAISVAGGLLPAMPSVAGVTVISSKSVARGATRSAGDQLKGVGENLSDESDYSALESAHQYFLTRDPGKGNGEEQVYLAAVDINTGQTAGFTPLPSTSPNILIDDARGILFQAEGSLLRSVPIR